MLELDDPDVNTLLEALIDRSSIGGPRKLVLPKVALDANKLTDTDGPTKAIYSEGCID